MIKSLLHFNSSSNLLYDEAGNAWQSFGNCSSTAQGKFHNALSLNRGYIQNNTINLDLTSDWTLDFWVYNDTNYINQPILSIQAIKGVVAGFVLEGYTLYIANKSGNFDGFHFSSSLARQWVHFALVYNNPSFYFFVNGKKLANISSTNILLSNNSDLIIGSRTGYNPSFVGLIDEVRVTDKAEWTSNFTPPVTEYTSKALYIGVDNSVMGMV